MRAGDRDRLDEGGERSAVGDAAIGCVIVVNVLARGVAVGGKGVSGVAGCGLVAASEAGRQRWMSVRHTRTCEGSERRQSFLPESSRGSSR